MRVSGIALGLSALALAGCIEGTRGYSGPDSVIDVAAGSVAKQAKESVCLLGDGVGKLHCNLIGAADIDSPRRQVIRDDIRAIGLAGFVEQNGQKQPWNDSGVHNTAGNIAVALSLILCLCLRRRAKDVAYLLHVLLHLGPVAVMQK